MLPTSLAVWLAIIIVQSCVLWLVVAFKVIFLKKIVKKLNMLKIYKYLIMFATGYCLCG